MNNKKFPLTLAVPQLTVTQLRFTYNTQHKPNLPEFMGSTWRGAFGHALKSMVCLTEMANCKACPLMEECAYLYLFETPPPKNSEKMRKYPSAPHPFVFAETQQNTTKSARVFSLSVVMNLMGRAKCYIPLIVSVMQQVGETGLGKKRQDFNLEQVEHKQHLTTADWEPLQIRQCMALKNKAHSIPPTPLAVKLSFLSPLRLSQDNRLVKPEQLKFVNYFSTLLRRISMLSYFHTDTALETNFTRLVAQAEELDMQNKKLTWQDWERHSSRQQRHVQMGGIVGEFTLSGRGLHDFWPYIWLGQWTHVGKGAVMGLGRYQIHLLDERACHG